MAVKSLTAAAVIAMMSAPALAQFSYLHDDGVSENGVGLTNGGTLGWMSVFSTDSSNNQITGVQVSWGSAAFPGDAGVIDGQSFDVYVFGDTDDDPTNGATLLAQQTAGVQGSVIDTDQFQNVPVSADITTPFFWIAASVTHGAGTFPAALDQTVPSNGRSWVALGAPSDPATFEGALDLDSIPGLGGVWLLRASAIPTPGAAAVLGVAGLAALRRRR